MSMKLEGLKELDAQLKQLGSAAAVKTMASQIRKAMKPVLEDAKSRVPVDSGALRDSLALRVLKPNQTKTSSVMGGVVVRPNAGAKKALKHIKKFVKDKSERKKLGKEFLRQTGPRRWHFIEFGTSRMTAKPFLRPSMDAAADKIVTDFRNELRKRVKRAARKQARSKR